MIRGQVVLKSLLKIRVLASIKKYSNKRDLVIL